MTALASSELPLGLVDVGQDYILTEFRQLSRTGAYTTLRYLFAL